VATDLRERVGPEGEVTALEPSEFYLNWFRTESEKKGWKNIRFVRGNVEETSIPQRSYDLVFVRWVMSFVPDPEKFLTRLFSSLRPGGIVALQDYYYEGLSLFPRGGPFDRMADVVRAHYRSGGGDPYVAGVIPSVFRKHGLRLVEFTPNCLAGGPESGVMEWAHRFFTAHVQAMVEKGNVSQPEGDAMLADWLSHLDNPDTLFFSPIVVDVAGVLPM
jgi:SAM-dependent methyltransferase